MSHLSTAATALNMPADVNKYFMIDISRHACGDMPDAMPTTTCDKSSTPPDEHQRDIV
jgi:hypothetical protein